MNDKATRAVGLVGAVEATAVFLSFYQALRVLFSVLFGLLYDALFAETVSLAAVGLWLILVILALLTPLAAPRPLKAQRVTLLASAVLVLLARIPLTFDDPQTRLVASIAIVAGTGLYLAARLRAGPPNVARPLILALVVDQLLRAAGQTWDVTLRPGWWPGQVAVSAVLCLLAGWLFRQRPMEEAPAVPALGLRGGLAWGGWLFLEMSLLAFPNALAHWSGISHTDYWVVASFLFAVTLLELPQVGRWTAPRSRFDGVLILAFLLACLALASQVGNSALVLLALMMAQGITLRVLSTYFLPRGSDHKDRLGLGLSLGGVLFLVLSFAYAFTFTYAYTLDLFRGMALPIVLAAAFVATLPVFRRPIADAPSLQPKGRRWLVSTGIVVILVALIALLAWPRALRLPAAGNSLRVATYNMHYGYDTDWHLSLEAQARTIEAAQADVVMLQEVDTGRPTSYMIDDALWLARRLGMQGIYLPCVEHLTGIALLSRYAVLDSNTLLLPSDLEQTGIIWAKLDVDGTPVNAFATWLGLEPEERARQIDAALPFIAAHPGPAAFGGDFNSTPNSAVYARIAEVDFIDPFVTLGLGSPPTDPAINPTERIDFVWLRGLTPLEAQVLDSTASDHRMVVVEVALP